MRHSAKALGLVVLGLVAPAIVSIGCGGAEWKPVAGPTVFPVLPEVRAPQQRPRRERHEVAAAPPPAASASSSAAPAMSASASASAKPPKPPKPPAPPKKK